MATFNEREFTLFGARSVRKRVAYCRSASRPGLSTVGLTLFPRAPLTRYQTMVKPALMKFTACVGDLLIPMAGLVGS